MGYGARPSVRGPEHPKPKEVVRLPAVDHGGSMRVCVTGGTGFLGGHVVRELLEAGHEVRVVYRDERRLNRLGALEPEPVKADLFDRAAMRRAVRGCDQLFHVAGFVGSRPAERAWQVNALGPRRAVEAAAAEDVERVVVTSSVAGLGPVAPGRHRHRGGPLPRRRAGAGLPRQQARGRAGGAGRRGAAGHRGGGGQPLLRARRAGRPQPAGRDLDAHDRQLPARPAAGRGGRAHRLLRRARRRPRAPARRRARQARPALRARRPRRRLGGR